MIDLKLDPRRTAVVVIDIQKDASGLPGAPHSTVAAIANCARLVTAARRVGALPVLVHVGSSRDGADRLGSVADQPMRLAGSLLHDWSAARSGRPEGPHDGRDAQHRRVEPAVRRPCVGLPDPGRGRTDAWPVLGRVLTGRYGPIVSRCRERGPPRPGDRSVKRATRKTEAGRGYLELQRKVTHTERPTGVSARLGTPMWPIRQLPRSSSSAW